MKGLYDTPESIIVIWYRPFSLFLGFFWSLAFAEVFKFVFGGGADATASVLCFILVGLLFVFLGVYQHWLLQYAKQIGRESRNLLKCLVLGVSVAIGYTVVSLALISTVSSSVSIPRWGSWVVGLTIAGWCGAGLGGIWYYHISPRQYEEKYGIPD